MGNRHRETVFIDTNVNASLVDQPNNTTWPSSYRNLHYKTVDDVQYPGYYSIKRHGGVLPFLNFKVITASYLGQPEYHSITRIVDGKSESGTQFYPEFVPGPATIPVWDESIITYVVNAAVSRAKQEAFDALTFAAELNKSSRLIASRLSQLLEIAKGCWRRPRNGAPLSSSTFSSAWLEARYGWRPILFDVQNILNQLKDHQRVYNEGKASIVVNLSQVNSAYRVYTGSARSIDGQTLLTGTRTYRGSAFAVGEFGVNPNFRPVTTAWELVPFSFVLDWFLDIGSWLSAITPTAGVDIRHSGYSVKDEYVMTQSWWSVPGTSSNWTFGSTVPGVITTNIRSYQRIPKPVTVPRLFPRLNYLRVIDIAAIVIQRGLPILYGITKRV